MITRSDITTVMSLYDRWRGLIKRCTNRNNKSFNNYGGRGITVCKSWRSSFLVFCEWSLRNGFQPHLTLDRRNTNGGYSPRNCRWATHETQNRNRRVVTLNVQQVAEIKWLCSHPKSYAAIGRLYGVSRCVIAQIAYGLNWASVTAKRPPRASTILQSLPSRRATAA